MIKLILVNYYVYLYLIYLIKSQKLNCIGVEREKYFRTMNALFLFTE